MRKWYKDNHDLVALVRSKLDPNRVVVVKRGYELRYIDPKVHSIAVRASLERPCMRQKVAEAPKSMGPTMLAVLMEEFRTKALKFLSLP